MRGEGIPSPLPPSLLDPFAGHLAKSSKPSFVTPEPDHFSNPGCQKPCTPSFSAHRVRLGDLEGGAWTQSSNPSPESSKPSPKSSKPGALQAQILEAWPQIFEAQPRILETQPQLLEAQPQLLEAWHQPGPNPQSPAHLQKLELQGREGGREGGCKGGRGRSGRGRGPGKRGREGETERGKDSQTESSNPSPKMSN